MEGKLKWRFDASTFKLLGRGLITDRITAIYELVKNCYDADATLVDIEFYEIEKISSKSKIIIRDNGLGMSLNDVMNKWLVVGTSSKRSSQYSPKYNRRYIGEKGVGRFATDKLGKHLIIKTRQKKDDKTLNVTINWAEYEQFANVQGSLFTDLENEYYYTEDDNTFPDGNGTELCITNLHDTWDKEMLLRLHNQLTRILSPIPSKESIAPFNIHFLAPAFDINDEKLRPEPIESLATVNVFIPFDTEKQKQGSLVFNKKTQSFEVEYIEPEIFGLINIQFYYFNVEAQKEFKSIYKGTQNYIEGVKIYRDGVICTPFAEYEKTVDTRRDILGIDKRRYVEAFDKLSSREVIGIVSITKDRNPNIIDATNRQDFVANEAYSKLKEFIIKQLDILVQYKFVKRQEKKEVIQNNLKRASSDAKNIEKDLQEIIEKQPELKEVLAPALKKATNIKTFVKEGIKDKEEEKKEFLRKENLYLSLMSLQDFANNLAHDIRFVLTPAKHAAEFFMDNYPNPEYEPEFKEYSKLIFEQTEKISTLVDFMLSYAQTDVEESSFLVKDLLGELFGGAYLLMFEKENINIEIDVASNIELTGNRKFIEDVLTNLISNSIKALTNIPNKKIKCESYVDKDYIYILFSDNGCGVDKKVEKTIFDMFTTTTAEQGGAGLGLFIAKTRMEALKGTIELVQSVYSPVGATFKLSLPLKPNFNKFKI